MKTQLPIPPPYHLVLFPRSNSSLENQIASFELASSLSKIRSEINTFEVIDFEGDFQRFKEQPGLPDEFKTEAYFIEASEGKFFKPGIISFVSNFDMGDLFLMMTNFQIHKPGLKALLMITRAEFTKWQLEDRDGNIECCIHQGEITKSMMASLCMISESC